MTVIPIGDAPGGAADAFDGSEEFPLVQAGMGKHGTTQQMKDFAGSGGGVTTLIANDEDITVPAQAGTTVVLYETLTAPRTVTFPPAGGPGQEIIIADAQNLATDVNTITPVAVGDDAISGSPIGQTRFDGIGQALRFTNVVTDDAGDFWAEITGVSPAMQQLLGSLGGTDGDGNVYSIEYDPVGFGTPNLAIKCVRLDGAQFLAAVTATAASLVYVLGDASHEMTVSDAGFQLDGVLIDPTAPWPGG